MQDDSSDSSILSDGDTDYTEFFNLDISFKEKVQVFLDIKSYACVRQIVPVCYTGQRGISLCIVCARACNNVVKEAHFYHCLFRSEIEAYMQCA